MKSNLFEIFILTHVITSSIFLLLAIFVLWRSITGWIKNLVFTPKDKLLDKVFLILLYFELILGIVMFFFIKRPDELSSISEATQNVSLRYWAIIHFSSMTFALFFCQIGWIFISHSKSSVSKFKYASLYYGMAIIITLTTLGIYVSGKFFGA